MLLPKHYCEQCITQLLVVVLLIQNKWLMIKVPISCDLCTLILVIRNFISMIIVKKYSNATSLSCHRILIVNVFTYGNIHANVFTFLWVLRQY